MTRFCQKVYDESDHFTTPNPVEVRKNHMSTKSSCHF